MVLTVMNLTIGLCALPVGKPFRQYKDEREITELQYLTDVDGCRNPSERKLKKALSGEPLCVLDADGHRHISVIFDGDSSTI